MGQSSHYSETRPFYQTIDWVIVGCYVLLAIFGWMNIYASIHGEEPSSIFDPAFRSGKQFIWIMTSVGLAAAIIFLVPPRAYETVSTIFYSFTLLLLVAVIFVGGDVKGSHSWFVLGPISFQPAEISKIATSLMLASYMSRNAFRMRGRPFWISLGLIALPMLIIVMEKETGSALVYLGFSLMLYREGLSGWILAIIGLTILLFILTIKLSPFWGLYALLLAVSLFDSVQIRKLPIWAAVAVPVSAILFLLPTGVDLISVGVLSVIYLGYSAQRAFRIFGQKFRWATIATLVAGAILVFSADFIFDHVLKDHQRSRIEVLLGMKEDLHGAGYNVYQSKIAIGSGGMFGKGYCCGTQTAYGFVPEQSTDFIFCTVGEEWGFLGCLAVLLLYFILIFKIIRDSEQSRMAFTRIYGYCVASCFAMHLFINVGMTLGLMPVIGIPLPFMSYGGSSMWGFTILLFIFVALNRNDRKYF